MNCLLCLHDNAPVSLVIGNVAGFVCYNCEAVIRTTLETRMGARVITDPLPRSMYDEEVN